MIQNNNNVNGEGMTETMTEFSFMSELPLQGTQIQFVHLFWLSGSEIMNHSET